MTEHQLILSLGGNLGNKAQIFAETSDLIENEIGNVVDASPIYETPPWGFVSENPFLEPGSCSRNLS
jgi:7,8-dihydro-6-hydroxymethylpterin-pyrophosphokinase